MKGLRHKLNSSGNVGCWLIQMEVHDQDFPSPPLPPWHKRHYWASTSSFLRLHDHTQTHYTQHNSSGRVIISTQRPFPDNTQHTQETKHVPPVGFEPATPASNWLQTHVLELMATGISGHDSYRD
jgi:hypothetical protein